MVRNRQYDLTPREEELMDMMWQANRPMSRAELRNMPVERSWKDNYLPVMLQALEKRGLIQVAGFVREGKTYARQFVPTWSKAELFAKSAAEHLEKDQLPQMLEAMAETSAGELDTERLSNVMAALVREQGQSQRETAGSPGRHLAGGRGGVTRDAYHTILFCNGSAVEQLADRSTLLEPKVSQDDSDAEFWLSGLSLSVLLGTDGFLHRIAVYRCGECPISHESCV